MASQILTQGIDIELYGLYKHLYSIPPRFLENHERCKQMLKLAWPNQSELKLTLKASNNKYHT